MKRTKKLTPLGIEVKKQLINKNMTLAELAERVGTSQQYLNFIMCGERAGNKYQDRIKNILEIK